MLEQFRKKKLLGAIAEYLRDEPLYLTSKESRVAADKSIIPAFERVGDEIQSKLSIAYA